MKMGRKKRMEKRHNMVDRVHKAVRSVHDFGHFSQHGGYFLVFLTMPMSLSIIIDKRQC